MKEVNKGILDNDMVISTENIQKIGEIASYSKIEVWKVPYLQAFSDLANFVMGE